MKVLLVKTSSLGDVVHALPAVTDAIAQGFEIHWMIEEGFSEIASMHPGVSSRNSRRLEAMASISRFLGQ